MGEKGGCGGKRGGDGGLVWRLWGLRQEKSLIHAMFYWNQETLARFSCHESVGSQSALPRSFLAAVFLGHQVSCLSAVVEDESPAVAERDLLGLPDGTLVVALGLCAGGVPFLVEPVQKFKKGQAFYEKILDDLNLILWQRKRSNPCASSGNRPRRFFSDCKEFSSGRRALNNRRRIRFISLRSLATRLCHEGA